MTVWIIGDIHGCAEELAQLFEKLDLSSGDRLVAVGDLFHRGPDPIGVLDLLEARKALFVLGNHEARVLERFHLAPKLSDASDRPPRRLEFPPLEAGDLDGDGHRPCHVPAERRADVVRFLQTHSGYFLEQTSIEGAGALPDGRRWCVVHAGLVPGRSPRDTVPEELISLRRLPLRGTPFWYEIYDGPNLILFGHTPGKIPRARLASGRLVALGLDTGCVYGGRLTAYSPELDEYRQVEGKKYADL
jgi:hypothetical protein